MLTFFAVVFLIVFVGILFAAALVEIQKKYRARFQTSSVWHSPGRRLRGR
jgi:hypothetical protein